MTLCRSGLQVKKEKKEKKLKKKKEKEIGSLIYKLKTEQKAEENYGTISFCS